MADIKVGTYICQGCGLGERLDTQALGAVAQKEGKAQIIREHEFLCNSQGVAMIQKDIDEEGVNRVVIGACSRRAKTEAFAFANVAIARVNLREQVIWSQPATDEARELTQEMAADYVRMGCAEVKKMTPPAANEHTGHNKRILVVGGGITGMTAALESSRAGYEVLLVEKTGALGGYMARLFKRVPFREPYADPQPTDIEALVRSISDDPRITVFLNSTTTRTSGAPGQFSVDITAESGATRTETVGAIVMASGFVPYDAHRLPEFGYGKSPNVMDQVGLEELATRAAAQGTPMRRPSDGKEIRSVVFVQCAGQRDASGTHLQYCSGHCCNTSMKQAMYFKEQNPDIDTAIIYTDLRTPGNGEDFYRSAQKKGVIFVKGRVTTVDTADGGGLTVNFHDLILDDKSAAMADVDVVVLATGQVPNSGVNIDAKPEADTSGQNTVPVSILNLTYRQGADVPQLKYGFTDSHFICFPYETRRTGIYTAGPVRRPMDIVQAVEDATGAALKAIQSVESAAAGRAVHPRSGDLSFPSFRREGCTQCKRCTVECPFGAIDEDEQRYPLFNESRCRRCGTCMGACPVRVISFENYSVDSVGNQIKAIDVPDEFSEKPRILLLACENDAYPALDMAGMNRRTSSAFIRTIPVRCLGSVNMIWVTDALNSGYDGVMMMGCKHGDDYQCHFVKGSELAGYRMSKIDDTLKNLNLEADRVRLLDVAIADIDRVPRLIDDYAAKIKEIGMSPFKGF